MHMLLLPYITVACLFCFLVPLIFKFIYIYSCPLFLAVLFLRLIFFCSFCSFQLCTVLMCRISRELKFPVLRSCLFFLPVFFLLCVLWHYIVVICFLLYLLFLHPSFFWTFYVVFPLLAFWPILQYPTILLVLLFFLVLPCAYASWAVDECMGEPGHPPHPQYSPKWSVAAMCRPRHPL